MRLYTWRYSLLDEKIQEILYKELQLQQVVLQLIFKVAEW